MNREHVKELSHACDVCGKMFVSRKKMMSHRLDSHVRQNRNHPCSICKRTFRSYLPLRTHILEEHDIKVHKDWKPGQPFHTDGNDQEDIPKTVHIQRNRKHPCPICKKNFKSYRPLRKHIIEEHDIKVPDDWKPGQSLTDMDGKRTKEGQWHRRTKDRQ